MRAEYRRHLLRMTNPRPDAAWCIDEMKRLISGDLSMTQTVESLGQLTQYPNAYYGVPPVVLVDEYDAPVEQAWQNRNTDPEYYEQMVTLMTQLLSYGLKSNNDRSYAVLTGIQRVALVSGSGLNNLEVYGVLDWQYDEFFGFTHEEVKAMADFYGMRGRYSEICDWYQGYRFGKEEVFNPWSVLSFIKRGGEVRAYWGMVSGNREIYEALEYANEAVIQHLTRLLTRETVRARIMDELVYPDLLCDPTAIFTLLLGAGFLTIVKDPKNTGGVSEREIALTIPNNEVLQVYEDKILATLRRQNYRENTLHKIRAALMAGKDSELQVGLRTLLLQHVSSLDVSRDHKENAYHMLLLGLFLPLMGHYSVSSNEESGDGRHDLCLSPRRRSDPGIIVASGRLMPTTPS